jgi:hypothetical protein
MEEDSAGPGEEETEEEDSGADAPAFAVAAKALALSAAAAAYTPALAADSPTVEEAHAATVAHRCRLHRPLMKIVKISKELACCKAR